MLKPGYVVRVNSTYDHLKRWRGSTGTTEASPFQTIATVRMGAQLFTFYTSDLEVLHGTA